MQAGHGDRIAFLWEGNDGESKSYTYKELLDMVSKTANMLKSLGVKKGDAVSDLRAHIVTDVSALSCHFFTW